MKVLSGLKADMPVSIPDNFMYIATDTNEKYLGTDSGNVKISPPYREVVLSFTQSNTSTPTIAVIKDGGYSGTFTGAYTSVGSYSIELPFALSSSNGDTVEYCDLNSNGVTFVFDYNGTFINIEQYDASGASIDAMTGIITIKVKD